MRNKLLLAAFAVCLMGAMVSLQAAEIDPGLESILNSSPDGKMISVLVFLEDRVDLKELNRDLNHQNASLDNRHEITIRALQEKATETQGHINAYFDRLKQDGKIEIYQAFWITNAIRIDAAKGEIEKLADHPDVARIYFNYEIELIEPAEVKDTDQGVIARIETGVQAVRAPEVWAMGYTGAGVLVANMDTGVDGNHPALASRWAGVADPRYDGHPEWAWYDPYYGLNNFPYDNGGHGTHTMGSITGAAPSTGDTVGVAPGAHWIAAAPIDRGGGIPRTVADAILSFQWFVDPDGNPSTNWDVPDVLSNSWGVTTSHGYPPCDELFWSYIDACETAGTVVLFAAGNEGTSGLRRPADRATDDYRSCAVAAVDANTAGWPIAYFSSRGPTYCTPTGDAAIKPDIAAPGYSVRSSYPGGGYTYMSGTSMACPHVAGVVALIREANPNLSVDQVKQIIYDTAYDLGPAGEDNSYGWGMVDAYEAVMMAIGGGVPPVADFSGFPTSGYAPLSVNFTDLSTNSPTSWDWDFGDGSGTSTEQNPSYTYSSPGSYTVTLIAANEHGSGSEIKANYITAQQPTPPVADFTGTPSSGYAPLTVQFTDLSLNDPTSWSWDFGDGIGTSAEQNPSYAYINIGTYTVTLIATNAFGSDTEIKTGYISVIEQPPYSQAFAQSDIPVSGTVIGSYTNTHLSDDDYQSLIEVAYTGHPRKSYSFLEHKWNFNVTGGNNMTFNLEVFRPANSDGDDFIFEYSTDDVTYLPLVTVASSLEQIYTHAMPDITGTIYVRVTDSDRSWDNSSYDAIYIDQIYFEFESSASPPIADFSAAPTSGNPPLTVQFTDLSTNNPTSWSWDFGDGSGGSTEQNPVYVYSGLGTYTVTLNATNSYGSDTETKIDYITVTDVQPGTMHVQDIQVSRRKVGPNYKGVGTIFIYDENNQPVSGATVYATATGPVGGNSDGITGSDGSVILETGAIKRPSGEWCFEVTDVAHTEHAYNPDANVVTQACESGPIYKEGFTAGLPPNYRLMQNFPNPFNASTEISFDLPEQAYVSFEIYDISGRLVLTLINSHLEAGRHSVIWNAEDVSSGLYIYRLQAGDFGAVKKMLLLK